jgi:hypothetical protein
MMFLAISAKKNVARYHGFAGPQSAPGRMLATLQSPPRKLLAEFFVLDAARLSGVLYLNAL